MGLETGTYISDLNASNPVGATDPKSQGDDHIRLIKSTILATFPSITGAVSLTHTQLNNAAIKTEANIFSADQTLANDYAWFGRDTGLVARRMIGVTSADVLAIGGSGLSVESNTTAYFAWQVASNEKMRLSSVTSALSIQDGYKLRVQDATNSDYIEAYHDGTNFNFGFVGTTACKFNNGIAVRIVDSGGTDSAAFSHDGTDFLIAGTSTRAFKFSGGHIWQISGNEIRVFDSTNVSSMAMTASSTTELDFTFTGINTVDFESGVTLRMRTGGILRCNDSTNTDALSINHDGTDAIYNTNSSGGEHSFQRNGTEVYRSQQHNGTGKTSGISVKAHNGTSYDAGFNVLPVFNDDTSDTLEASHAGTLQVKETTTGVTLTLEANTSTDFPVGACTQVANVGTSVDYTITEGTGTTLYYVEPGVGLTDTAGGCTLGVGGVATIYRRSSTDYWIWGSEITA